MGQLVDGTWTSKSVLVQHDKTGLYFKRESVFRNHISPQAGGEFPAEPGRYPGGPANPELAKRK